MGQSPFVVLNLDFRVIDKYLVPTQVAAKCHLYKGKRVAQEFIGLVKSHSNGNLVTVKLDQWNLKIVFDPSAEYYHIEFHLNETELLKEDLDKYKLLVEAASDIIYEANLNGEFIYVNPKAIELTGFSKVELIGTKYIDLIREDWVERVRTFYRNQLKESIRSTYLEFPIINKIKEEIWVGQNVQLLETEKGIVGSMAVARDITGRHKAQNALKLSEEKYRSIIQNLQFGLMEVDLSGTVIFANEAMTEITGYSKGELIGQNAEELLLDQDEIKVIDKEHEKRGSGISSAYELALKGKEGQQKWTLISGAPKFDLNGEITGSIGIHVDITDRKESEKELLATKNKLNKYKVGLESLNSVTSNLTLSSHDQIQEGLKLAKKYLGLDLAIISEISGVEYRVKHFVSDSDTALQIGDVFNLGNTYCELVIENDDILFLQDVSASELSDHPCHAAFGIESYLGVSYRVNGEKRGTVNFSSPEPRAVEFDAYDLEFINLFSKWIGYTITLKENQEKLKEDKNYLSAINGFVTSLLEDESIEAIAWEIAENVIDKFGFEDCVIYLKHDDSPVLKQLAAYGPKQAKKRTIKNPIDIPIGQGIVGTVAKTGISEIVADTSKDSRYVVDDAMRLSEITVPIIADGKVIGVIDSEHPERDYFQEEHLNTLTTIANLASNRLKNAIAKSKQQKAESALKENEVKLRKILENAIDGVISIDDHGIIRDWNKQAEVIFGFEAEEVIGKTLQETIIPHNYRKQHTQGMSHYMATGEGPVLNQKIEISALRKNGEEFPIELAIIPVITKGQHSFTAFVSDITVQRRVKEEMEKALTKEKELNELKSRFVSMTSHEFRTPLTTIKQNIDLISYRLEKKIPEAAGDFTKYIGRLESEIKRVTDLINDILMLGRIDAGKVAMKLRETDFLAYVTEIAEKFSENRPDGRVVDLIVKGVPRKANIDTTLFDHILNNLISNAFKYSEGAANPELHLEFNELKTMRIIMKDHGIGIPEKDHKSLFQSFYRATNVKNIQGSGLGLSIVREFTMMHGGEVNFRTKEQEGTEFILDIPYN